MKSGFLLRFFIFLLLNLIAQNKLFCQLLEANKANHTNNKVIDRKSISLDQVSITRPIVDSLIKKSLAKYLSSFDTIANASKEANKKYTELLKSSAANEEGKKKLIEEIKLLNERLQWQKKSDELIIINLITEKNTKSLNNYTLSVEAFKKALLKLKDQLSVDKRKPEESKQYDIQYFLDSSYYALSKINDSLLVRISTLNHSLKSYEKVINQMNNPPVSIKVTTELLEKRNATISKDIDNFEKDFNYFSSKVSEVDTKIQSKRDIYKFKSKETAYGAIPGLAAVFGQREVVPNITLLGSKIFASEKDLKYGEIKFFTGATTSKKEVTHASSLFIVETSSFGFTGNFSYGFIARQNGKQDDTKRLSINLSANYLGKNLQPDTLNSFSVSLFLGKLGVEYLIANKGSFYFNWCGMGVIDNLANFEKFYDNRNQFKNYSEFGTRFYLDLSTDANLSLKVDLNFIYQNDRVKEITNNKDIFIPNIRIGLAKTIK